MMEIQQTLWIIKTMGLTVTLEWVTLHVGIKGNKIAEKVAEVPLPSHYRSKTLSSKSKKLH